MRHVRLGHRRLDRSSENRDASFQHREIRHGRRQLRVLGPLRVMAPCMAMGEAAGQAAAMTVSDNGSFAKVDVAALRTKLAKAGAIIDWT